MLDFGLRKFTLYCVSNMFRAKKFITIRHKKFITIHKFYNFFLEKHSFKIIKILVIPV